MIDRKTDKLKMLWPYSNKDGATWKYKDCIINGHKDRQKDTRFVKKWILNPGFKYKHLDPNYPKEISD